MFRCLNVVLLGYLIITISQLGKLTVFGSDSGNQWDWFCGGKKVGELFKAWWDESGIRWD